MFLPLNEINLLYETVSMKCMIVSFCLSVKGLPLCWHMVQTVHTQKSWEQKGVWLFLERNCVHSPHIKHICIISSYIQSCPSAVVAFCQNTNWEDYLTYI